jgi:hypothetical protein
MPPYEAAVLSDRDAADIYARLRQMSALRDPNGIPQLRQRAKPSFVRRAGASLTVAPMTNRLPILYRYSAA